MKRKIIAMTIIASMLVGNMAFAKGNNDELYANACNLTIAALQNKDQPSINKAREAIAQLPSELSWAIGEFSRQLDGPQQKLFEEFMGLIFEANGSKKAYDKVNQENINKARRLVNDFSTYPGNKMYIESWSSAVDEYQQDKINKVVSAIEKAGTTKSQKDIDYANDLLIELLKVQNNNIVYDYAKGLEIRLNAMKLPEDKNLDNNPMAYREHVYFVIDSGEPSYKLKYDELNGWRTTRVGFDTYEPVFGQSVTKFVEATFQYNYLTFGPYVATQMVGYTFKDSSKNYAELIRLADGYVLEKIHGNGKIETFTPPTLTAKQIKDFETKTYDQLANQYKGK